MKQFLAIFLFLFAANAFSQDNTVKRDSIYNVRSLETKPEFPGGMSEFYKFIQKNFKVPSQAGGKGRLVIKFVIEADGTVDKVQVLREIGFGSTEEAVRVLMLSPKWKPGEFQGVPVAATFVLPISL